MNRLSSSNQSARSPVLPGKTAAPNSACYTDRCLQAGPSRNIVDPADYKYQDPSQYPDPTLRSQYIAPIRFIDLMHVDGSLSLSTNFQIGDFMVFSHDRYAIFSPEVAHIFQLIRNDLGGPIWITSGYRSPLHNAQVGGVPWSRHMYGDAVDFTTPSPNYPLLQNLCLKYDASFTLIYTDHIHCDWRKHPLNPAFYGQAPIGPAIGTHALPYYGPAPISARIVSRLVNHGQAIEFGVNLPTEEIEGSLIYDWQVTAAQNTVQLFTTKTATVPVSEAPFKIEVVVGGSIHLEKTWP